MYRLLKNEALHVSNKVIGSEKPFPKERFFASIDTHDFTEILGILMLFWSMVKFLLRNHKKPRRMPLFKKTKGEVDIWSNFDVL